MATLGELSCKHSQHPNGDGNFENSPASTRSIHMVMALGLLKVVLLLPPEMH
jgi:hypothetical protein